MSKNKQNLQEWQTRIKNYSAKTLSSIRNNKALFVMACFAVGFAALGSYLLFFSHANPATHSGTPVSLEGTVEQLHYDDFDTTHANEKDEFYLKTTAGDRLLITGSNSKKLQTQSQVRINGYRSGKTLTLADNTDASVTLLAAAPALTAAPRQLKVAVVLINYKSNPQQPFTTDLAKQHFFTDSNSVNAYYKENSFNKLSLVGINNPDGDVFGWITIDDPTVGSCDNWGYASQATSVASAQGIDLSQYEKIAWVMPSCGGIASLGGVYSFTTWGDIQALNVSRYTYMHTIHEFGHSLGFHHALGLTCKDSYGLYVSFSSTCVNNEYGDGLDPMGNGYGHFSGFYKNMAGWFDSSNIQAISANGDYTIAPIDQPSAGAQLLRITNPKFAGLPTDVEFRAGVGFDKDLSGVVIRLADTSVSNPVEYFPLPYSSQRNFIKVGSTFLDYTSGFSLKVLSVSPAGATVRVSFGRLSATKDTGECAVSNVPTMLAPGQSFTATFTIKNTGRTDWSATDHSLNFQTLKYYDSIPQIWTQAERIAFSGTINHGTTATVTKTFTIPATGAPQTVDFSWRLTNEATNEYFGPPCRASINIHDPNAPSAPPLPATINLQTTTIGTNTVSLSWSGAGSGVSGYKLYRKGGYTQTFTILDYPAFYATTYTDQPLSGRTSYSYYITAVDQYGNESAPSNTITIKTN